MMKNARPENAGPGMQISNMKDQWTTYVLLSKRQNTVAGRRISGHQGTPVYLPTQGGVIVWEMIVARVVL